MNKQQQLKRNKKIHYLSSVGCSDRTIGKLFKLSHVQIANIRRQLSGQLLTNCTFCGFPDFKLNTVQWDYGTWLLCDSCLASYKAKREGGSR